MSNKFDSLFDPNWSELKIIDTYYGALEEVRNSPNDLEELRQAFYNASLEHSHRIDKREKEENILILE